MSRITLRRISLINTPLNVPPIRDITDQLPRHPSYTWDTFPTRRDSKGNAIAGKRKFEDIKAVAVHHTGVIGGSPVSHANYKIRQGLPGNPYHIQIVKGQPLQTNDLLSFTYGVGNHNDYTIHVAVEGDFTQQPLLEVDRNALYAVLLTLDRMFPNIKILGHNEFSGAKTSCPGFDMNRVRRDVEALKETLEYQESPNSDRARAYSIAERILDLYNKAQDENFKYRDEAIRKLLATEKFFKEQGWI